MAFINGFLAIVSTFGPSGPVELALPGYNRAPIAFGTPANGTCVNTTPFSFGTLGASSPQGNQAAPIAGLAVFDSPGTGTGNALLLMPYAAPRPLAGSGPSLVTDVGEMRLYFAAMASFPDGAAFTGNLAAGVVGSWFDELAIVNRHSIDPATGRVTIAATMSPLSAAVALKAVRGILSAA